MTFHKADGTDLSCPWLQCEGVLPYSDGHGLYEAVQLPSRDRRTVLTLVLPSAGTSPSELLRTWQRPLEIVDKDPDTSVTWPPSFDSPRQLTVRFPRMSHVVLSREVALGLSKVLSEALPLAFASSAAAADLDFVAPGASGNAHVTQALQLRFEEQISSDRSPSDQDVAKSVLVDHPFLLLLSERESGVLLLATLIDDPSNSVIDDLPSKILESPIEKQRDSSKHEYSSSRSRSISRSPRRRDSPSPRRRRDSPKARTRRFGNDSDRNISTCLFVGNLSSHIREHDIESLFGTCGRIKNIRIGINKERIGYAFVLFEDRRDAEDALEKYQNYDLDGSKMRLDWQVLSFNDLTSRFRFLVPFIFL